jgi:cytochrome c5
MKQFFAPLALAIFVGCGSTATATQTPGITTSATDATATQIDNGKKLYVQFCARCHGDAGQGVDGAPPVVGAAAFPLAPRAGAKRDVQFHTAADVFAWTIKHMPGDAPGSLATDQYLAIFAFDLTANGVNLSHPLDGALAATIVLHP